MIDFPICSNILKKARSLLFWINDRPVLLLVTGQCGQCEWPLPLHGGVSAELPLWRNRAHHHSHLAANFTVFFCARIYSWCIAGKPNQPTFVGMWCLFTVVAPDSGGEKIMTKTGQRAADWATFWRADIYLPGGYPSNEGATSTGEGWHPNKMPGENPRLLYKKTRGQNDPLWEVRLLQLIAL